MTVERTSAPTAPSQPLEQQVRDHPERFRVLTGDRPTGPLHLGHYFGTLANRVRLQRAGVEVFLVIADYQVITDRDGVGDLSASVREVVLDYLAAGIDPARATIFTHSAVPALNQLVVPFLSLVTVAELGRNPTVKAEADATRARRGMSGLLFTYPVHQAADILFCHGNLVPVGSDQLPHLELTRLIASLQRAIRGRDHRLSRARCTTQRRSCSARHRRHEDEQEPRQRHRARRRRGPHGCAAAQSQDGQPAHHHL